MERKFILGSLYIIIITSIICSLTSCKQNSEIKPELLAVKEAVMHLDSMSIYLYGWEPNDSTSVPFDDSALEELIEKEQPTHPLYDSLDIASVHPTQVQYDKAEDAWNIFKDLCNNDHYDEALANFYNAHNDLLLFLKHSTLRYQFYLYVVFPLILEYEGFETALDKYIIYLELQQSQAEASIALGEIMGNNYMPEVYPDILMDLAEAYTMSGDLERGLGMITNIIDSIELLTNDIMLAEYSGIETMAKLYSYAGDNQTARMIWLDYRRQLPHNDNNIVEQDEEIEYYRTKATDHLMQLYELND